MIALTTILLLVVLYVITAITAYGLMYGSMQYNWPDIAKLTRREDRTNAAILCLAGPCAIFAVLLVNKMNHKKTVFRLR